MKSHLHLGILFSYTTCSMICRLSAEGLEYWGSVGLGMLTGTVGTVCWEVKCSGY